jgi:hypothetical protein
MPYAVEVNTADMDQPPVWSDLINGAGDRIIDTFATQDEAVEFICQKFDRLVEKTPEIMTYSDGRPMFPEGHEYEIDANVIFNTYRVVELEVH